MLTLKRLLPVLLRLYVMVSISIIPCDDNITMTSFPFRELLPKQCDVYYRYEGSLTTPPCHQSVVWNIFQTPILISKRQILKFRVLGSRYINHVRDIADNYRDIQPINGRFVFTNDIRGILPSYQPTPSKQHVKENQNSPSEANHHDNKKSEPITGIRVQSSRNNFVENISNTRPVVRIQAESNNHETDLIVTRPVVRIPAQTNLNQDKTLISTRLVVRIPVETNHNQEKPLISTRPVIRVEKERNRSNNIRAGPLISQLSRKLKTEINHASRSYRGSFRRKYSNPTHKLHLIKKNNKLYLLKLKPKPRKKYIVMKKSQSRMNNSMKHRLYSHSYGRRRHGYK